MVDTAQEMPRSLGAAERIFYEMPLTERMRTFLRLEFLFKQLRYHAAGESKWATRAAIASLLKILSILGRGDVRSEVLKELERCASGLARFQFRPGVDESRLGAVLESIDTLRGKLQSGSGQIAQHLRENEFLNAIKHRSAIPGGTSQFYLPDYSHWLSQTHERRAADMNRWLDALKPLREAVHELLWLTRQSTEPSEEVAVGGIYQRMLQKEACGTLLRIALPPHAHLFPEISGSQHRFTIRFLHWEDVGVRPVHVSDDVPFLLTLC